jgi:DNA-binding protein Fis
LAYGVVFTGNSSKEKARNFSVHQEVSGFVSLKLELVGARPLHLAGARPLGRLKAPLGLSLLRKRGRSKREITPAILHTYLPEQPGEKLPMLFGGKQQGKTFESEREILYQVLFDMRQDVTELKKLVHDIMTDKAQPVATQTVVNHVPTINIPSNNNISSVHSINVEDDIQDTEEYVEESLSLDDLEKEMIRKALQKHHGKRKNAAKDLNISERTLYRKIKEYGLDK